MFSREKGYKIRAKVHGKGGNFFTSRLAWLPLLELIAVTGGHLKVKNQFLTNH